MNDCIWFSALLRYCCDTVILLLKSLWISEQIILQHWVCIPYSIESPKLYTTLRDTTRKVKIKQRVLWMNKLKKYSLCPSALYSISSPSIQKSILYIIIQIYFPHWHLTSVRNTVWGNLAWSTIHVWNTFIKQLVLVNKQSWRTLAAQQTGRGTIRIRHQYCKIVLCLTSRITCHNQEFVTGKYLKSMVSEISGSLQPKSKNYLRKIIKRCQSMKQ